MLVQPKDFLDDLIIRTVLYTMFSGGGLFGMLVGPVLASLTLSRADHFAAALNYSFYGMLFGAPLSLLIGAVLAGANLALAVVLAYLISKYNYQWLKRFAVYGSTCIGVLIIPLPLIVFGFDITNLWIRGAEWIIFVALLPIFGISNQLAVRNYIEKRYVIGG